MSLYVECNNENCNVSTLSKQECAETAALRCLRMEYCKKKCLYTVHYAIFMHQFQPVYQIMPIENTSTVLVELYRKVVWYVFMVSISVMVLLTVVEEKMSFIAHVSLLPNYCEQHLKTCLPNFFQLAIVKKTMETYDW